MSTHPTLQAETRSELGSTATARYRSAGKVPAVIMRPNQDSLPILLDAVELHRELNPDLHSINVVLDGETRPTLIKGIDRDCLNDAIIHIELLEVTEDMQVKVRVPLNPLTRKCPGLKAGGMIETMLSMVRIRCAVRDIPDHLDINLDGKQIGHTSFTDDISVPEGIKVLHRSDTALLTIITPRLKSKVRTIGIEEEELEEGAGEAEAPEGEAHEATAE